MGKVILFVLGCAAWTLGVVVLTAFIGNSGWRGIELQAAVFPNFWWVMPLSGAILGMALAMANMVGPWPRLAWRKIFFAYALFAGLPCFSVVAYVIGRGWTMSGHLSLPSFGTYIYIDPQPATVAPMLWFIAGMCAVVIFFRIWKHRRAGRVAKAL